MTMKRNFIISACLLPVLALLFTACSKSFLEIQPKGLQLESNYYQTPDQAFAALVAAYNPMGWEAGGSDNTYIDPLGPLNSASDECYAGGGGPTDMAFWQVWNNYTLTPALGPQAGFWDRNYTGIYRVNIFLSKIDGVQGLDPATKARYIAEAKFLRAYYYFWLVRLFKNIPLITHPLATEEIYKQTQAPVDSVYHQIETDLKEAIPDLPWTVNIPDEGGRATKGAAYALMGKLIMWEAGPNNNSRMLEAAAYLDSVNFSGYYHLVPNFPDIFSPDNKFNSESILEIVHTGAQNAGWGNWPNFLGNVYTQMVGPRSYSGPIYWSGGWSFNPIIPSFVDSLKGDPRYPYTVADIDSIVNAAPGRSYTAGYDNTGYFIQKYAPLAKYVSTTGQPELNFPNDYIEIRLADTYLLEAEALIRGGGDAGKAGMLLNAVRERVGLPDVAPTLKNIYHERMIELATEGHRWFDLVRLGWAPSVLAFKGFQAGKHELLPIPLVEMNNTQLKQNPGY
ncbi:MAG: RagB/SusD family nutrient uptake outer membrane protein [Thermoflavifilum aggregans]|nr:RagB/SusD family nutrient uptake outer membrane protein [Thermoflavifilum aggregans]